MIGNLTGILGSGTNLIGGIVGSNGLSINIVNGFISVSTIGGCLSSVPNLMGNLICPLFTEISSSVALVGACSAAARGPSALVGGILVGTVSGPRDCASCGRSTSNGYMDGRVTLPADTGTNLHGCCIGNSSSGNTCVRMFRCSATGGACISRSRGCCGAGRASVRNGNANICICAGTSNRGMGCCIGSDCFLPSLTADSGISRVFGLSDGALISTLCRVTPCMFGSLTPIILGNSIGVLLTR